MSLSYLNHFLIQYISLKTIPFICLVPCMVKFFFFYEIVKWVGRTYKSLSRSQSSFQSQIGLFDNLKAHGSKENQEFELPNLVACSNEKVDGHLWKEDVEIAMTRLGIFCHPEGEKLHERLGSNDLSNLFEEEEPSLDEVKEAFDVFDENRDGFIDARELQRVLHNLGFVNGLETDKCRMMIGAFDDNKDGKIDFNEFVKFMENIFC